MLVTAVGVRLASFGYKVNACNVVGPDWASRVSRGCCGSLRRALGDPEYKLKGGQCAVIAAPEVRRLRMRPGDAAIILASDGLWDVMDDCEAVDIVEKVRSIAVLDYQLTLSWTVVTGRLAARG